MKMKRTIALLIVACLSLVVVAGAQAGQEFKSSIFDGLSVELMEDNLKIIKEESTGGDFPIKLTFNLDGREKDTQIVAYLTLIQDYVNNVTIDLPKKVFKQWDEFYKEQITDAKIYFMPEDQKLMSVKDFEALDEKGETLYFTYAVSGKYKENLLLNYFGVVYGVHIQVSGQAKEFDQTSAWSVMAAYYSCVDYAFQAIEAIMNAEE